MYKALFSVTTALAALISPPVMAKNIELHLTAKEVSLPIDNKGTMQTRWTYDGQVPGPVLRVTEGDTVTFTLTNEASNKNSHSIDLHAARVSVVKEFEAIKPGETKTFTFTATYPGAFFYHCGADPMNQHIARGMYGVILVDPKDPNAMPKADREYVLVQSEIYANPDDVHSILKSDWQNVAFNGMVFKYDPVHDPEATRMLVAKPGERVRIYFINAGPNEFSSFHPIAGIWDAVYPSGNPKNKKTGLQSMVVGPGDGATFDLISPTEGANAIVDHSLSHALTGAIAVLMFTKDADPKMGRGDLILVP
ncbi:MAG: nitrite reductase [Novosphingobium sp.]|nr:nitrite reductase [Novosphingobium sp.]|tara:strand:- start:2233 stop:3156 length:924 start_codon:yes stop_codon:yes gene_type:complete